MVEHRWIWLERRGGGGTFPFSLKNIRVCLAFAEHDFPAFGFDSQPVRPEKRAFDGIQDEQLLGDPRFQWVSRNAEPNL